MWIMCSSITWNWYVKRIIILWKFGFGEDYTASWIYAINFENSSAINVYVMLKHRMECFPSPAVSGFAWLHAVLEYFVPIRYPHQQPLSDWWHSAQLLTHWGRDKMAAIAQTTLSNAFSWMKMLEFRSKSHWKLFMRVPITIFQHWFRWWLGADQASSHYLYQWWLYYRPSYA